MSEEARSAHEALTREAHGLTPMELNVLGRLCFKAEKLDPFIYNSGYEALAIHLGISTKMVQEHIKKIEKKGYLKKLTKSAPNRPLRILLFPHSLDTGRNLPVNNFETPEGLGHDTGRFTQKHRKVSSELQVNNKNKSTKPSSEWNQISTSAGVTSDFHESNLGKPLRTLRENFSLEALCYWAKKLNPPHKVPLIKGFIALANDHQLQENLRSDFERDKARRETPLCDLSNGCNGNGWIGDTPSCKFQHNDETRKAYELKCDSEAVKPRDFPALVERHKKAHD